MVPSSAISMLRPGRACARRAALSAAAAVALLLGASAAPAQEPAREPVRWDQQRVTKMSQDLASAVHDAREAVRRSPMSQNIAQRTTYYELLETMRLVDNTARHLRGELEAGKGADETRATYDRLSLLRRDAEESVRRAMEESVVLDALVKAGSIHNQMRPYYHGKG